MISRTVRALLVLAVAGGCSVPPSSPSVAVPSPTAGASAAPSADNPSGAPVTNAPWRTGVIDQGLTTPALEFRSTGTHLIWSSGARADREADVAPDLFASEPGGAGRLVYDNPNRGSRLEYIDGIGTKFAFMEVNNTEFGPGNWKLWYMREPAVAPALVDEGGGGQLPFFSISEDHVVWTAVHGQPAMSQLLLLDLRTMEQRLLAEDEPGEVQYWFPDVDGQRIVYGTVEPNEDFTSDERHVYLLDLERQGDPVRLDQGTSASEPTIQGDNIVWKESDPRLNFLVAGSLVHYSIASGSREPLTIPNFEGFGFVEPTVGERYAAAWPESDRMLYIADLETGDYPPIMDLGDTNEDPHDAVAHPDIEGDLLAYKFGPAGGELELHWILLR